MMAIFGGVNAKPPSQPPVAGAAGDMTTSMRDCGELLRCCVQADLGRLPSKHEIFFGKGSGIPSNIHAVGKAQALLGFQSLDPLDGYFHQAKI